MICSSAEDIILGAGIAGLSCAYHMQHSGSILPIFEASDRAGGLLDSFDVGGWIFDNGVHLSFATEPEVRAVFDRTEYIEHRPISLNFDDGTWLRHPVQNNLFPLPVAERVELITDLLKRPDCDVVTYRDWLLYQYGSKIASRWPLKYTRKYWTVDASELGIGWIGNRMRRAELEEVLLGAMEPDPPNTYYISEMRYPRERGYRAFIEPLIEKADVRPLHRAVAIDWEARKVHFSNGLVQAYSRLVSTMPLPALISLMTSVPEDVRSAADTLFATRMDIISVGISKPAVSPSLWFYIYDTDILAARAYSPSWKSPNNAPDGFSSLQFEIYSSVRSPAKANVDEMKSNCIYALAKMGLANSNDILFIHHKHIPYANVVFDIGMEQRRDIVRSWLRTKDIILAGRFGEWEYLWSNQSFMSGLNAARTLLSETTTK